MAYVTDVSRLLTETVEKLSTLNRHQLAGHVANLSFWTEEVRHCLHVIDDYHHRFEAMKVAQTKHAVGHHTSEFALDEQYDLGKSVPPPKRVPDNQLKEARRTLCDAFYGFIVRCQNAELLDQAAAEHAAANVGISIDQKDLKS